MHIFIGNFSYVVDFMIVEDISSIIDPRLSQVVLGKPFVEISNMTYDLSLGVVKFTNGINEIAYKIPHKIKQYNSLSDLEKEHTKSVYLRNEEDKRRGVEYVISKILWFYKECLELEPKYLTRVVDEGGLTKCAALSAVNHFFQKTFSKSSNCSPWMHTRASNSELVEPLSKPKHTLNRRLRQRNRRVPFERRDERPAQPRIVYLPILDINYFRYFLDFLENYNLMDDEPMWDADCVVALTSGSTITILETVNEFTIKDILQNYNPMDDEPIWAADRVVAPTPGSAITILETANEFAIKAKTCLDELNEETIESWDELRTAFISRFFPPTLFDQLLGEVRAFSQH
ncbi:hypothetical protein Tco_0047277 [Tanacetum coccineum]